MPLPIEYDELNQTAVLWSFTGVDSYNKPERSSAEEINVRWRTIRISSAYQAAGADGGIAAIESVVTANVIVDREIEKRSLMWLGTISEFNAGGSGSGTDAAEVMEVLRYSETFDIKGIEKRREVELKRFQGDLPDAAAVGTAQNIGLVIEATGLTNGTCTDCTARNVDTDAAIITNMLNYQEWQSATITGGGGTGICAGNFRWNVQRYLEPNEVRVTLTRIGVGAQAIWTRTGATWDGDDDLVLNLSGSGTAACGWPATLTIRGDV